MSACARVMVFLQHGGPGVGSLPGRVFFGSWRLIAIVVIVVAVAFS